MRRSGAFGASAKTTTEIDQPHHPNRRSLNARFVGNLL
jgi:hypothetical protein